MALPLKGKKSKLTRNDLLGYFARERLLINEPVLKDILSRFAEAAPIWRELVEKSFLTDKAKVKYLAILMERTERMQLRT